jgi:branched-subunit amino acid transport protein
LTISPVSARTAIQANNVLTMNMKTGKNLVANLGVANLVTTVAALDLLLI